MDARERKRYIDSLTKIRKQNFSDQHELRELRRSDPRYAEVVQVVGRKRKLDQVNSEAK